MASIRFINLGVYPTPVAALSSLSTSGCTLWVKRDDLTHSLYGGNKVRKLERILADAKHRGATKLLTVGAAGSHHVLATAVHGRHVGLSVEAVLVPQPRTDHVVDTLRAGLAAGLHAIPASGWWKVPFLVGARLMPHVYWIPPGGSNLAGVLGYVDAARELASQVRSGVVPEPDTVVVALGSGGTAAGLAVGFAMEGMKTRVRGIGVAEPRWAIERSLRGLLRAAGAHLNPGSSTRWADLVDVDWSYIGGGYGHGTPLARSALARAADDGIALDLTYTAKTFAAALDLVASAQQKNVLYWHTLSSASLTSLLENAVLEDAIPSRLRALLV